MKKVFYCILIFLTTLFACSDSINQSQDGVILLSDTTQINYKQTLYNFKESLSIQFYDLVSDSRCPIDAICVWEGNAEVKFKFVKDEQKFFFSLHTYNQHPFNRDTTLIINNAKYNIEMVELKPYPKLNTTLKKEDYKASIVIKKNQPINY